MGDGVRRTEQGGTVYYRPEEVVESSAPRERGKHWEANQVRTQKKREATRMFLDAGGKRGARVRLESNTNNIPQFFEGVVDYYSGHKIYLDTVPTGVPLASLRSVEIL